MKNEKENYDRPALYIIVNKDIYQYYNSGEIAVFISEATQKFMEDIVKRRYSLLYGKTEELFARWWESGTKKNTIILEADDFEIYGNCLAEYDNLYFKSHVEEIERVGEGEYNLSMPVHTCLVFFGLKSEMPKWVRKLPLAQL